MSAAAASPRVLPARSRYAALFVPWPTCLCLMVTDVLALSLAAGLSLAIRLAFDGHFALVSYLPFALSIFLFLGLFTFAGLYPGIALNAVHEFERVVRTTSLAYLLLISLTFFNKDSVTYSRVVFFLAWALTICLVAGGRRLIRSQFGRASWWGVKAVIFHTGDSGSRMLELLNKHPDLGLKPIAMLAPARLPQWHEDREIEERDGGIPRGLLSEAAVYVEKREVKYAIITMPDLPNPEISRVINQHAKGFSHILLMPEMLGRSSLSVSAKDIGGHLGLEVSQALSHPSSRLLKRSSDIAAAAIIMLMTLPIVVIAYVWIKLSSSGPGFFGHERIGLNQRPFVAWKFRTMVDNSDVVLAEFLRRNPEAMKEWTANHKLRRDPRVTPIGRFLRRTSLDELPQLWNVLLGEMSLVGPRPIVNAEAVKYGDRIQSYARVAPGLTGLWQISGRNNTSYEERVRYDDFYVQNWSIWLDLYILVHTAKTVLFAEGAY